MLNATTDAEAPAASIPPRDALRLALDEANIPTLALVLTHLTGDRSWLTGSFRIQRAKGIDDNDTGGLPKDARVQLRDAVWHAVQEVRAGLLTPGSLSGEDIAWMLAAALDEEVPASYGPLLAEELGLTSRDVDLEGVDRLETLSALIVGSGLSGLCAAIKLKAAGIPFTILEKNRAVGGTWHENTYPGCGVDTPSHFYSFAFAPNHEWERYFAKREQLHAYLERLAKDHAIEDHVVFGAEVESAAYDEATQDWRVSVLHSDGRKEQLRAKVLITAVGVVNRPSVPELPGVESFDGPVMHTAQWQEGTDLTDKRVAVVGTGASAMQLVPSIVDAAEHVVIFQRSKQWAVPHPNYQREVTEGTRFLMQEVPFYAGWYRLRAFWNFSDRLHSSLQIDPTWEHPARSINADNDKQRAFLTRYITDQLAGRPDLIEACVPDYPPYGKRMLLDNGWFRCLTRDDVSLVSERVVEVRERSVVDAAGVEHPADILVFATGFRTLQFLWPMEITGRGGRSLREHWGPEDARAYLGMTVPGFPNLFILNGPNTNAGHGGSAVIAIELQVRYLMQLLGSLARAGAGSVEVKDEVYASYNAEVDEALSQTIWSHQGMTTYYRNSQGRIVTTSPWKYIDLWERTLTLDPQDYVYEGPTDPSLTEKATSVS